MSYKSNKRSTYFAFFNIDLNFALIASARRSFVVCRHFNSFSSDSGLSRRMLPMLDSVYFYSSIILPNIHRTP